MRHPRISAGRSAQSAATASTAVRGSRQAKSPCDCRALLLEVRNVSNTGPDPGAHVTSQRRIDGARGGQARSRRSPLTSERRIAWAIFLLLFGIFGVFAGGHSYSSDEEGYFLQARSLLTGHYALTITSDAQKVTPTRPGRDDKPIATGGIGAPVAGLPGLAIGKAVATLVPPRRDDVVERLFVGFTNSLITAAIAAVLFLCACLLGADRRQAVVLSLVFALGTMAWPHAKTLLLTEPLAALLVLTAVYFAFRATSERSLRWAAAAGAFSTLAGLARLSTLLFVIPIGAYVVLRAFPPRNLRPAALTAASFTAGATAGLVLLAVAAWWRAGSPTDAGYTNVPLNGNAWEGLYGLLLSPGKSIFLYAPVVAVAVAALPLTLRRRPAETTLLATIVFANLILFARFPSWHGDNAWGPRYLQITLPLMVLLVAPALSGHHWRQAVVIAGTVGVLVNSLGAMVYFNQYFVVAQRELAAPAVGDPAYLDPMHFDVQWSPIVGHAKLLDDSAAGTADDINAAASRFPDTPATRLYWYFRPQVDTWWYWLVSMRAPRWLLLLGPGLLLCAADGMRRLRRSLLQTSSGMSSSTVFAAGATLAAVVGLAGGPLVSSAVWLFMILAPACLIAILLELSRSNSSPANIPPPMARWAPTGSE